MRNHRFLWCGYGAGTELRTVPYWRCAGCGMEWFYHTKPTRRDLRKYEVGLDCNAELARRVLQA